MESNHDEVPVSIANMPGNPCRGVCVEDQWQEDKIGYEHNGAGQRHHQTNKHLQDTNRGEHCHLELQRKSNTKQIKPHTHRAKPAGDIIHGQKHRLKNRVKNHIRVRERVKVE